MINILCDESTLLLVREALLNLFYQKAPAQLINIYCKIPLEEFEYEFPFFTQKNMIDVQGTRVCVYFDTFVERYDIDSSKDIFYVKSLFLDH